MILGCAAIMMIAAADGGLPVPYSQLLDFSNDAAQAARPETRRTKTNVNVSSVWPSQRVGVHLDNVIAAYPSSR